jgi:hypothetical protein
MLPAARRTAPAPSSEGDDRQSDDQRVDRKLFCQADGATNEIVTSKHKDDQSRDQGQNAQHIKESTLAV